MEILGHSPAQAARAIGISQSALQAILDRKRAVGIVNAPRIAKYLGVDEPYLFAEAGIGPKTKSAKIDIQEAQIREIFRRANDSQKQLLLKIARDVTDEAINNADKRTTTRQSKHNAT